MLRARHRPTHARIASIRTTPGQNHHRCPDVRSTTLHKLLSASRYWAVIKWYVKEFVRFGRWLIVPATVLMLTYYFAVGKQDRPQVFSVRIARLALVLTLAGYFVIYLITPYDIYWHLRFSLDRLFLQLWPSAIFLFFLSVNPCGAGTSARGRLTLT